jgi:hypothetical protein
MSNNKHRLKELESIPFFTSPDSASSKLQMTGAGSRMRDTPKALLLSHRVLSDRGSVVATSAGRASVAGASSHAQYPEEPHWWLICIERGKYNRYSSKFEK